MVPKPTDVGLPSKFSVWRPNQPQVIEDGLESVKRFIGQVQRPGAGKTVSYIAQALLNQGRALVVTSTKGLQDQLLKDFGPIGLKDIRGKSSYPCACNPGSNCEEGSIGKCLYKGSSMCNHTAAKSEVMESNLVTTNYSCWIASNKYSTGLGQFDLLILDEAHNAPQELAKAMRIQLSEVEITEMLKTEWPDNREEMEAWKHWALVRRSMADERTKDLKKLIDKAGRPKSTIIKEYRHFKNLTRKLADIAVCKPEKWVVDDWNHGYQFDPIDAAQYGERVLFQGIPKVILTSGTIKPKTLEMLGIDQEEFDFFDYPSKVDVARSPLMYIPTVRVWRYSQDWELMKLVNRIDEIVESRFDRKGIIHTVSFKLRDFIMSNSKYSRYFVSNYSRSGDVTSDVVNRFKVMDSPAVLVSPSVTTGYDFPYETCRYQIIAKLPWPDMSSKVEKARKAKDPERDAYLVMQSIAQAFGRGDRAEDDYQEVFIVDDSVDTFFWKFQHLAPTYLPAYYRKMSKVPAPLELEVVTK